MLLSDYRVPSPLLLFLLISSHTGMHRKTCLHLPAAGAPGSQEPEPEGKVHSAPEAWLHKGQHWSSAPLLNQNCFFTIKKKSSTFLLRDIFTEAYTP